MYAYFWLADTISKHKFPVRKGPKGECRKDICIEMEPLKDVDKEAVAYVHNLQYSTVDAVVAELHCQPFRYDTGVLVRYGRTDRHTVFYAPP